MTMFSFLKYLIQLLLAPAHGWEDMEKSNPDPEELLQKGLYPLMGIAAITEFLAFFYQRHVELGTVLIRAVADFGSYFVSVFIAKLIFDYYLGPLTAKGHFDTRRAASLTVAGLGLRVLIQIITNCLPWSIMLMRFMPLYVVLVLYKAIPYMEVRRGCEMRFLLVAAGAVVAVPLLIYYLLYFIIP